MRFRASVRVMSLCAIGLGVLIPACKAGAEDSTKQKSPTPAAHASTPKSVAAKPAASIADPPLAYGLTAAEAGRQEYLRYQCYVCHGMDLKGGIANPNAQGGEVPALVHVAEDYTMEETLKLIRNGRSSPLDKSDGPTPPIAYMPSWKGIVVDPYIHNIASFIWSKQEKKSSW